MKIQAQVWLPAKGVRFRDLKLLTVAHQSDGGVEASEHSEWPVPEQVGSVEFVEFSVPQATSRLTTCLTVPSPGLQDRYRVTQAFAVRANGAGADEQIIVSPVVETKVSRENGIRCGSPD
jgi:hypothetical protein